MKSLVITIGEPAGIGPDIIVKLFSTHPQLFSNEKIVVIGNKKLLQERATTAIDALSVIDFPLHATVIPGKCDIRNSAFVMKVLTCAAEKAMKNEIAGIVTAPIHKAILNDAGFSIAGHTDFFSTVTRNKTVMMLMTPQLKVALFSDHLPLREVPLSLTPEKLSACIRIILHDLKNRFQIAQPRVLVCGLNPHAGEHGYLGTEERDIMIPVIRAFQQENFLVSGPVGADIAFTESMRKNVDVILTMYHDQGLPVIKYAGFHEAINVTLGLPFIRTSVDHGTALDIAGTDKADVTSLYHAIITAKKMYATSTT
ncbi:MAG: 4-hydroxythreonine-4-phosphate dehydrogenase PdxA [Gammaproteobacteria bacterium RIFCSPLOWO2_02_FULL_42_14]|nr:MAG: 4-hydroxythreonine-4-phosphate dehydrogenase PdxA [Gammaproteobacteria bacterium RIFCSPHIGHO2_02_FULL_42_43]OGT28140.1 MAG: 4-hydroxythreonine-4-phosphate dehydrogenase PdxA [Gammaproteobacteria bacterium RIFCSPHIGHO2_01_FULL_42_8]OGT51720.1 MAG: 4-hydroxythreonine-4-phosphate dehydrogenase PdxA [Gammaproteobacteria bacterium RIFCSPHIGHO2_12_FULL_41_25]OGT61617.1 MAG: 4-hydroxythreonine-4-phosphate dehydrogenase PdxA [Gammaproteobacteria bacterium RIFCSPLOWO2_02_FULL_42_14]OGT86241.1 MA